MSTLTVDNAKVEDVLDWLTDMADKGMYPGSTARDRRAAIEKLVSALQEDESKLARDVLTDIDNITTRYARLTKANPGSARTYKSRAKKTLEEFFEWLENPTSFQPKLSKPRKSPTKKKEEKPKANEDYKDHVVSGTRDFPLPGIDPIVYKLPKGFNLQHAKAFAAHLMTLAEDFDPSALIFRALPPVDDEAA